tara:strand:+ start:119 stop:817 length:699 start_codon:yes stop_codon:yes gene_type:complete
MNNIFIFYIPGSMGSLLSTLVKSQMDKSFLFHGFGDKTAHNHIRLPYKNTHDYYDYVDFLHSKSTIEDHLRKNKTEHIGPQNLDIHWSKEFINKNYKCVISYVDDYKLKLGNYYWKVKLSGKVPHDFKIKSTHKDSEKINYMKTMLMWIKKEQEFLKVMPKIEMLSVIRKQNFEQLEQICNISDKKLLIKIIDDYNRYQTNDTKFAEDFMTIIDKLKKANIITDDHTMPKNK